MKITLISFSVMLVSLFPFVLHENITLIVLRTEGPDYLDLSITMHGNSKNEMGIVS